MVFEAEKKKVCDLEINNLKERNYPLNTLHL